MFLANRLALTQPRERAKHHYRYTGTVNRQGAVAVIASAKKERVMVAQAKQLILYQIAVIGALGAVLRLQHFVKFVKDKDAAATAIRTDRSEYGRDLVAAAPAFCCQCRCVDNVDVVGAVFASQGPPDLSLAAAGRTNEKGDARAALEMVVDDH